MAITCCCGITRKLSNSNHNEDLEQISTELENVPKSAIKDKSSGSTHNHSNDSRSMNTKAVFLHVLSDFFGSIAVVVSALILWLVPNFTKNPNGDYWKNFVDPTISLVMVILILIPTIPLLKKSTFILLQTVPEDTFVEKIKCKFYEIVGIENVHDLHIWRLHSKVIIGTVHISISCENDVEIIKKVKNIFHDYNIHCTTIQCELNENSDRRTDENDDLCILYCYNNKSDKCNYNNLCCPKSSNIIPSLEMISAEDIVERI